MLYLLDNNEKTSWMILFSQGTGLAIEAWKITKAVGKETLLLCIFFLFPTDLIILLDIAVVPSVGTFLPYTLLITDKHVLSEDEKKTQEFDKIAFRYVTYVSLILSLLCNSEKIKDSTYTLFFFFAYRELFQL